MLSATVVHLGNFASRVSRSIGKCRMSLWTALVVSQSPRRPSRTTGCLEGRFRQGVNLHVPRSVIVHAARGRLLVSAVFLPFWHGSGTS